ncbi:sperm acrosome membrane-associated protein 6 [Denticeps clupeoides]|uniref:sperm acrosome membrane-associated protein 6 n=1 Tax=Denticeps clupeoides TaxID=299321 RepID=UPI0010A30C22|nr:sperm acrosome membrane-associated protein 6 [Denticeps clupeoides]
MAAVRARVLWLMHFSSLAAPSLSCFQCFVSQEDSLRLCWGHIVAEYNIRNIDSCFKTLDRIFNDERRVITAGEVGRGYDVKLKEIMLAEILPIVEEFDQKTNEDSVYEDRLQTAAGNFVDAATRLPRASGCFPPCGFQASGAVYNCITCQYDSCEFPLDCPVKEVTVGENNRTLMSCDVLFKLPGDIEIVWRYAKIETTLIDQFEEVTVGLDPFYFISSTSLQHQGTYQCEIFSKERSLVRIYFYLRVTPQDVIGQSELQSVFNQVLLSGHLHLLESESVSQLRLPPPALLTACLTSLLLLLFLCLGALFWWSFGEEEHAPDTRPLKRMKYFFKSVHEAEMEK